MNAERPQPKPGANATPDLRRSGVNVPRSSISDRLDKEYAPAWRPEPGDKLVGVVVEVGENDAGWGDYPVVTVMDDDGNEAAVHAFHTVLRNELTAAVVGDRVGIIYKGKVTGNNGTEYESYRVIVEPANPAPAGKSKAGDDPPVLTDSDEPPDDEESW
jgi:hypothetical protein